MEEKRTRLDQIEEALIILAEATEDGNISGVKESVFIKLGYMKTPEGKWYKCPDGGIEA